MAQLTGEQMIDLTHLLLDYAMQWHCAHLALDTGKFDDELKKETEYAMKIISFVEAL